MIIAGDPRVGLRAAPSVVIDTMISRAARRMIIVSTGGHAAAW
jgi:hypothetical protein